MITKEKILYIKSRFPATDYTYEVKDALEALYSFLENGENPYNHIDLRLLVIELHNSLKEAVKFKEIDRDDANEIEMNFWEITE